MIYSHHSPNIYKEARKTTLPYCHPPPILVSSLPMGIRCWGQCWLFPMVRHTVSGYFTLPRDLNLLFYKRLLSIREEDKSYEKRKIYVSNFSNKKTRSSLQSWGQGSASRTDVTDVTDAMALKPETTTIMKNQAIELTGFLGTDSKNYKTNGISWNRLKIKKKFARD